jgi:hypothetical protein
VPVSFLTQNKQGAVTSNVVIECNDPDRSKIKWPIEGVVKRTVHRAPVSGVSIRSTRRDAGQSAEVRLTNQMDEPLRLQLVKQDVPEVEIKVEEVRAGQEYVVRGTTLRKLDYGTKRGSMTFRTGQTLKPEIEVPLWLAILAPVEPAPKAVYLNPAKATGVTRKTIVLHTYCDPPPKITGVQCVHPEIHAELSPPMRMPASKNKSNRARPVTQQRVTLTLPPAARVPTEGVLVEFLTDHPDLPKAELLITTSTRAYQERVYGGGQGS